MAVRVVTDSAAELTDEESAKFGVEVVPLMIRVGEEEFVDRKDLTPAEFYDRLARSPVLPETAAPSPGAIECQLRATARKTSLTLGQSYDPRLFGDGLVDARAAVTTRAAGC